MNNIKHKKSFSLNDFDNIIIFFFDFYYFYGIININKCCKSEASIRFIKVTSKNLSRIDAVKTYVRFLVGKPQ